MFSDFFNFLLDDVLKEQGNPCRPIYVINVVGVSFSSVTFGGRLLERERIY